MEEYKHPVHFVPVVDARENLVFPRDTHKNGTAYPFVEARAASWVETPTL